MVTKLAEISWNYRMTKKHIILQLNQSLLPTRCDGMFRKNTETNVTAYLLDVRRIKIPPSFQDAIKIGKRDSKIILYQ